MNKRTVCIVSSTRADWGLLSPIAKALKGKDDCEVKVVATNMHLSERFGMTVNDIISDGFIPEKVEMPSDDDNAAERVKAMGICMSGFAEIFTKIKPDVAVILGDRYEMLAVASAAAVMRIPIVHIAGGTISEGAIDDSIRHAITKLASIHLTETEDARRRVIAMGEDPARVINTGAIGVWNIHNIELISREELGKSLGMDLEKPYTVATFHPATLDTADPGIQCREMLTALAKEEDLNIILTYPNNDSGSASIIEEIETFSANYPGKVKLVKSLGLRRYLSALEYAEFSIGNSSSGIVEVASSGIPSIDIGIRQRGRLSAKSVIHCGNSTEEISKAIKLARSPEFKNMAARRENPYFKPNTLNLMVETIMSTDLSELRTKHFYENHTIC